MCSKCGIINNELTLDDREWTCPNCRSKLDRDLNAAINIKRFGLNPEYGSDCRNLSLWRGHKTYANRQSSKKQKALVSKESSKIQGCRPTSS